MDFEWESAKGFAHLNGQIRLSPRNGNSPRKHGVLLATHLAKGPVF